MGDYALISAASKFWQDLRTTKTPVLFVLKYWFSLILGSINYSFTVVFRFSGRGVNQTGIVITTISCLFLMSYNCSHIWIMFKGLGMIFLPLSLLWKTTEEFYEMVVTDCNSIFLLYYTGIVFGVSLMNVCKMFIGNTNRDDMSSRGTSNLYLFVNWAFKELKFKKRRIRRQFVEGIFEPLFLIVGGVLLFAQDIYASVYLWLMAFSEISIQAVNKAESIHIETKWKS